MLFHDLSDLFFSNVEKNQEFKAIKLTNNKKAIPL